VPKEDGDDEHLELMQMNRAIVSPDASFLAISTNKLLVLDPNSTEELQQLENPGSHVAGFAFSPDGKRILASAWGKPVQIKMADGRTRFSSERNNPITMWNATSGEVLQSLVLPDGGAGPVAFSRDGNQFAVCFRRPHHSVAIFETASGNKLKTTENLPCSASAVAFTYDGKGIITGLADGTAVIWSLTD
jgi:WD40 repeat protein